MEGYKQSEWKDECVRDRERERDNQERVEVSGGRFGEFGQRG